MNLQELKKMIMKAETPNFLIFCGEEWQTQQVYIGQISKKHNLPIKYIDEFSSIYQTLKTPTIFQQLYCYVVRDDKDIMSNEKLQQQLLNNLMGKNILILILTSFDRRTRLFKNCEDKYINFEKLSSETLKKQLKQELHNCSDKLCDRLIDICENDYGRLLLEVDKLKTYNTDEQDWNSVFEILLNDGTIYIPPKDAIFELVNAILKRQVNRSYYLLEECRNTGINTLAILSVLYDNAKQVLQLQCFSGKDIEKATGMNGWQIKSAKALSGYYSDDDLKFILRIIQKVESGIKKGIIDEAIALDYVLVNIL